MQTDQPMEEPFFYGNESLSYWQSTAAQTQFSSTLPTRAEVVVVGGGLLGAATTYWLARAGIRVVLLERVWPAYGATGRNGGFVVSGTAEDYTAVVARLGRKTASEILRLTLDNQALLRQIVAEEAIACDYREPGTISLALGEEELARLRERLALLQTDGYAVELLDREAVQQYIKTPLGPEIAGGGLFLKQALVHSARLVQGLVSAAQRHGARIYVTTVQGVQADGTSLSVQTQQGTVHAGAVVVAVNAWTGEIIPQLASLITPVRGQMLAYEPVEPVLTTGVFVSITATGEYMQQTVDGSIVLGGCREVAPGQDINVRSHEPSEEVQAALEQVLPRLFPKLPQLRVVQRWAGLMGFTADYLPLADRVPEVPGAWCVGGFSGHGMPFGIRVGQLLAEAVSSGVTPPALTPLSIERQAL